MSEVLTRELGTPVAGGTDAALHPMTVAAFAAMRALSTRNDEPEAASRPFAADRDGFVLGEGAGVLVLESVAHATARGARILAVLAGAAVTADAFDTARPEPSGTQQERALRLALERAGTRADQIGLVNAHATSTPIGDQVEAEVLIWSGVHGLASLLLDGPLVGEFSSTEDRIDFARGVVGLAEVSVASRN